MKSRTVTKAFKPGIENWGLGAEQFVGRGGVAALLDPQGFVAVVVEVGVDPGAGVSVDEARLPVAGRMRRVVPVVRLRPFLATARGFGA